MKKISPLILFILLLNGCVPMQPTYQTYQAPQLFKRYLGTNDGAECQVDVFTTKNDSNPNLPYVHLRLAIDNGSSNPINTNFFSDKLIVEDSEQRRYEVNLDPHWGYKGRIINPGASTIFEIDILDISVIPALLSNSSRMIYFAGLSSIAIELKGQNKVEAVPA
jgi:hypothetical protein